MLYYSAALWLNLLVVLSGPILTSKCSILRVPSFHMWSHKQLYPAHKIPDHGLETSRSVVKRKIVLYHNFFRTKVRPTASNMLLMSWHPGAARQAQEYAEKCRYLQHNPATENTVPHLGACGQNLFVAAQKTPWFFAIKRWFLEYQNFTYGSDNYSLHDIGHYTQMVWATSHKVGCGMSFCKGGPWGHFYNYVCHYCPGGNILPVVQYPYKAGNPCADCPNNCLNSALCTNVCTRKDYYSNCNDLFKYPGVCETGNCNATCSCTGRIHKNHPWI